MKRSALSFFVAIGLAIVAHGALGQTNAPTTAPTTQSGTSGTIANAPTDVRPLSTGDRVPVAALTTADGKPIDLAAEVAKTPTVLIFYRGGWCPFCNAQMNGLQGIVKDLQASGYQLLAISPDLPAELNKSIEKHTLTYTLLSDPHSAAIQAFGLAYRVNDETYAQMQHFGVDLEKATGDTHHILPVPAVYIVGTDGVIRFVHYDPDYRKRMDSEEILKAAKSARPN